MRCDIVIGGKAGQGPNILSEVISQGLVKKGFYVFYSRDYQSLIRGGHNFNQISFSDKPIHGNSSKVNLIVCLDEKTEEIHKNNLVKDATVLNFVKGKDNMYYAGVVFKLLNIDFKILENELKKLKRFEENRMHAKEGFDSETRTIGIAAKSKNIKLDLMNGSKTTALSAIKSGLDFYYAYPMTPATPLMIELGEMQLDKKNKHKVIELENEISVALTGFGSSSVGKIVMVGTSGGGFDLMTEAFSFGAMAEIPMVFYLSQRPGPGTGVATYTSQGDLNLSLHSGHGEFFRIVVAPGDREECIKLINDCFYYSYEYRIPSIFLTDKHLGESKAMMNLNDSLKNVKKVRTSIKRGERFNSYEHDKNLFNVATEDAKIIKENFDRRKENAKKIEKKILKTEVIKIHGNKNSKNLILSWGSTKGAILDAISENKIDVKFVQILYMSPFPSEKIKNEIKKAKKILVVENNSESPLSRLVAEKTGFIIEDKNKILRYDGRPFFSDELANEIRRRIK